jgi:hypothetical protein
VRHVVRVVPAPGEALRAAVVIAIPGIVSLRDSRQLLAAITKASRESSVDAVTNVEAGEFATLEIAASPSRTSLCVVPFGDDLADPRVSRLLSGSGFVMPVQCVPASGSTTQTIVSKLRSVTAQ